MRTVAEDGLLFHCIFVMVKILVLMTVKHSCPNVVVN